MGFLLKSSRDFDGFPAPTQTGPGAQPPPWVVGVWIWTLLALALGIAFSLWLAEQQRQRHDADQAAQFQDIAVRSHDALRRQLDACGALVRAVQTLFLTSDGITQDDFQNVYANLRPQEQFPSLRALVYAQRQMRADGEHFISVFVAPVAGNERVFGLDVNRQPTNLAAVIASRDTDQPALSAPFRLVQSTLNETATDGVIVRLPIFAKGAPPATPAERRARLVGTLGVSFRISELIHSALQEEVRGSLHITVADVTQPQASLGLYDSHPPTHAQQSPVHVFDRRLHYGGRTWRVVPRQRGALPRAQRPPAGAGGAGGRYGWPRHLRQPRGAPATGRAGDSPEPAGVVR